MDRRMLLAMLLAVIVLIVNSLLFGPRRQAPQPLGKADSTSVHAPLASPGVPQAGPASPNGQADVRFENTEGTTDTTGIIRVQTRLVSAELDPIGGELRSWRLNRYTDALGEPANLVRTRAAGALWFALRQGSRTVRTDSTHFRVRVERNSQNTIVRFAARDRSGLQVEKEYQIPADGYECRLQIKVDGLAQGQDGAGWDIGWLDGLPILERDPRADNMAISSLALLGKSYVRTRGTGGVFGCARGGGAGEKSEVHDGTLHWIGVRNRYFLGALLLDEPRDRTVTTRYDGTRHEAGVLVTEPLALSGPTVESYRLYLGPIQYSELEKYGAGLERVQDLGPGLIRPISRLLMKFFEGLHHIVPNYGFEILILSILIRLIFYPLTKKSMDSMKRMQQLKPEMDRINERFKDDPERKNKEILDLYRKNKINPLGGCIPVLIQLPVLSGLYYVLANAVQLRKEPFILWIHDLSAPDTVGHIAGFPVNVMPLIMAGTMLWQQKMTPTDPRQASMAYIMPVFMTFIFYTTPSGLVFYWTVSNLMTALQQAWMNRGREQGMTLEPAVPAPTTRRGKKRVGQ